MMDEYFTFTFTPAPYALVREFPIITSGSGAYWVDERTKTIRHPEKAPVRVPPRQFELMKFLHANRGIVFSENDLIRAVWHTEPYMHTRPDTVRMTVMFLRRAVGPDVIETVTQRGYGVAVFG